MRESYPHQGIRIDRIPVEGAGGLIFALGMPFLLWLALPPFRLVMAVCLLAGILLAPVLYKARH